MNAPTLTTDRLTLAPPSMAHWEAYHALWTDPEMGRYITGGPRDRQTNWVKFAQAAGLWALLGYGYFSIIERETGKYVGTGGLGQFERGIDWLDDYPEAGWAIAVDRWGMGYATEAMAAVLDWADGALGSPEIRCIIDIANTASHNVAAKLGFAHRDTAEGSTGQLGLYSRISKG